MGKVLPQRDFVIGSILEIVENWFPKNPANTVPNNSFGFWADLHLDGHV